MTASKKKSRPVEKGIVNRHFHSMNPNRLHKDGSAVKPGFRTKATIKRLQIYRNSKPKRNAKGKIIKEAPFQGRLPSGTVARVVPDRRWFGNTRLISQETLQEFREKIKTADQSPYEVVLKRAKLPTSLLTETCKAQKMNLLDVESFEDTFGKKSQRKRPKITNDDLEQFAQSAKASLEKYEEKCVVNVDDEEDVIGDAQVGIEASHPIFKAGTSRRIWGELYKVIDSSDVLIEVLDARDPIGTRCTEIESYMKKHKQHKHLVLVLNKCDLVPNVASKKWHRSLAKEYPTVMFKACVQNPYGRKELMDLLRQYASLHKDHQQISVGIIGYPNVGKSSLINTLRHKAVCQVAPVAGQTKVWQYVTLMKRIYLIDCPGCVIRSSNQAEWQLVLGGAVRIENIPNPEQYVEYVMDRVDREHLRNAYRLGDAEWTTASEFIELLAKRMGRLVKGGEPDVTSVSRIILNDYQRSKLPHHVPVPKQEETDPN